MLRGLDDDDLELNMADLPPFISSLVTKHPNVLSCKEELVEEQVSSSSCDEMTILIEIIEIHHSLFKNCLSSAAAVDFECSERSLFRCFETFDAC